MEEDNDAADGRSSPTPLTSTTRDGGDDGGTNLPEDDDDGSLTKACVRYDSVDDVQRMNDRGSATLPFMVESI